MADLIDRNALRRIICAACAERPLCTDIGNICFEVACINNAPKIEATPKWIPCSERLPEKDVSVLIYAAGHRVTAYFDAVKGVFRLTETDGLFYLPSAVTHWMPLPEPPEVNYGTVD